MSPATQSTIVMITTWVLWILVPAALLIRGRFLLAGFGMLLVCFLPLVWQGLFTDSDAPGFGLMFLLMVPIPLLLIAIGLIAAITGAGHRALRRWKMKKKQV